MLQNVNILSIYMKVILTSFHSIYYLENHREMLSEMCNKARHKLRRFGAKMYCNVYGSFYGLMESSLTNICAKNTA